MRICLEDGFHALKAALSQFDKGRAAMINRWMVHGP
jgi:hypothetical protein